MEVPQALCRQKGWVMNRAVLFVGLGIMLLLAGTIWFLQGIGVLPGSFMSGDPFWAWAGLACLLAGLVSVLVGLATRART
jgi:hypothetical protein